MTCSKFPNLWEFLKVHLQFKAARLSAFFSRFLVLCLIAAVMAGSVPPAHADLSDIPEYYKSNLWDFLQGRDFDWGGTFWNNVIGYAVGQECPSSPDKYHHGSRPASSHIGGRDENGSYRLLNCNYCGKQFKAYSSFGDSGQGFGGDFKKSYDKGKCESVLVLTERLTRYEIILRVLSKTAQATVEALRQTLTQFPKGTFQTITVDNGSEFSDCEGMEQDVDGNKRLTVYYCHPYSSCERGSNERNNRIIRRFFHKGHSLRNITQTDCDFVADKINNMPRKILDYSTAQELFNQELSKLTA